MSQLRTILGDIADLLNGATFSQSFTASSAFFKDIKSVDWSTLTVFVIPTRRELTERHRTANDVLVGVTILIGKNVKSEDVDEVDSLITLVEEIETLVNLRENITLATSGAQRSGMAKVDPIYDVELLDTDGIFGSQIDLNYRAEVAT